MEAGAQQRRRGGDRRGDDPGDRTTRARGVSVGNPGGAAGRPISSFPGEAAIHTESRWEAAAIGDPDGAGPGGADGGEVVMEPIFEADFQPCSYGFRPKRSAQQALEAIRVAGNQGHNFVVDADIQGYFDNIQQGNPDGVGEGADLGPKGFEVTSPMAGSGSDGGRDGEGNAGGNPAGRSDLAAYWPTST